MKLRQRYVMILISVLLMISAIVIIDISLREERHEAETDRPAGDSSPSIPVEEGVFRRSGNALLYENMPENEKSRGLDDYYANRAYYGAPPAIPHPLLSVQGIGGDACLQCHENGGYVEQFAAFTPVTPHPELANCVQCHVPVQTDNLFKNTNWEKKLPPRTANNVMPGSPPIIPHTLQMRENCLACHAGPAAPKR